MAARAGLDNEKHHWLATGSYARLANGPGAPWNETTRWLNGRERRCDLRTIDGARFKLPLYTVADAARIVDVPASTLTDSRGNGAGSREPD